MLHDTSVASEAHLLELDAFVALAAIGGWGQDGSWVSDGDYAKTVEVTGDTEVPWRRAGDDSPEAWLAEAETEHTLAAAYHTANEDEVDTENSEAENGGDGGL